ncbi:response regulator transcription factor [Polaromonas sp.]|uniref:response regulator transcription factor n=1 Tax=Polaromonas sp. TaxID=1869339 RepID=UPI002736EB06|nr:response regulator transcription factor [Polaromonas sp.]
MLPRWSEAFQEGRAGKIHTTRVGAKFDVVDIIWLRLEPELPVAMQIERLAPKLRLIPCVVLSDRPTDEEALAAFAAGARGYCNTHAAAQMLIQIAAVVLQGGLWIGESLMQRLVSATSRLQALSSTAATEKNETWSKTLTDREEQVARTLAGGASNKEIARALGITDRTVKAHVGAILEKLQVRDRLQLSLIVNRRG